MDWAILFLQPAQCERRLLAVAGRLAFAGADNGQFRLGFNGGTLKVELCLIANLFDADGDHVFALEDASQQLLRKRIFDETLDRPP